DASAFETEADAVEGGPHVERGGVVGDGPLDRVAHRGREALAVRQVAAPFALDRGDPTYAERQIGAGTLDAHAVGALHAPLERLHGLGHAAVVEGAHAIEEVLEGSGAE